MRNGAHFRRLRDSFMSQLSDFVNGSILVVHHASQSLPNIVTPAAAAATGALSAGGGFGYLAALASSSFLRNLTNVSHLCSAGWYLLCRAHAIVPPNIF